MGIEGVSINQLRVNPEVSFNPVNSNAENKKIDGLMQGNKIDPDEEKEKQQNENTENEDKQGDENNEILEAINYDLSDASKYQLNIDEKTNNVLIVKKDTNEVIQIFSANVLSKLTGFIKDDNGILVNRKF